MIARMYPASPIKGLPMGHGIRRPDLTAERLIRSLRKNHEYLYYDCTGKAMTTGEVKDALWHEEMARKYRQAASYPWFPVTSDPAMPSEPPDSPDLPEPE